MRSCEEAGGPVGPEGQVELAPEWAAFWRLDFGGDDDSLVLLADNYSLTITNITARGAEHAEDERTETTIAQIQ